MARSNRRSGVPANLLGGNAGSLYPEIYFKLQPELEAACERWEQRGIRRPTQAQLDEMANEIRGRCNKRRPDLMRYADEYERQGTTGLTFKMGDLVLQQRGGFSGLIAFLLLAELFRRRGRRFY